MKNILLSCPPDTLCSCRGNSLWSGSETVVRPWMSSWECQWTEYTVCELEASHGAIWWSSGWIWVDWASTVCVLSLEVKAEWESGGDSPEKSSSLLWARTCRCHQSFGIGSWSYKAGGDVWKCPLLPWQVRNIGKECGGWSSSRETHENLLWTEQSSWILGVSLVKDCACIMESLLLHLCWQSHWRWAFCLCGYKKLTSSHHSWHVAAQVKMLLCG